ncbi:DUF4142 domain-containing protein [Dyadobacter sandarakinus]|uniref:DUF4142 domain-containing protein n=1 Tax=Dyadobacter sandarakinus TaxID=2747268 RepID=A0ABX7IGC8_9BACT|nr:DUF4142 domain-containing protein [Dyadobacter sandarakinus]QRR03906.1 DUF4142 domain-containing protein [Dyadobacter sandarakinus]
MFITLFTGCKDGDRSDGLVSEADRQFISQSADAGLFQVNAGQIAASQAMFPAVAAYGQQMTEAYTPIQTSLKALAVERKISLSATLSREEQGRLDSLATTPENLFDSTYMDMMARHHLSQQRLYNQAATNASDNALKEWAASQLPAIVNRLDKAKAMHDTLVSSR